MGRIPEGGADARPPPKSATDLEQDLASTSRDPLGESESYSAWSERIANEYARKQRQKKTAHQPPKRNQQPKRPQFPSSRVPPASALLTRAKTSFIPNFTRMYMKYQTAIGIMELKLKNKQLDIKIENIPFPGGENRALDSKVIESFVATKTDHNMALKTLKRERIRWHPDKFAQTFSSHFEITEVLKSRVVALFQSIDLLYKILLAKLSANKTS